MAELIRDPNTGSYSFANPNTVINSGTGQTAGGIAPQPVAQAPASPVPQMASPSAPVAPSAPTAPQPTAQAGQQSLTMPATGSVVDLLTMAGQDASFGARQQLAQQFGIQGYTGTAAQNQELSKKYLDAYNANKGTAAPESGAQASTALDSYFQGLQPADTPQDPTRAFMDVFAGMNPIEANIFQQLSGLLSSTQTQQSLTELWTQEMQTQGIPGLQMELADVNRIMDGTEDDIRDEISNVGGFATESQVQALTSARNKTLLKKATYLSNVLQAKNDYVDRIVSLTQADRKQVSEDLDRKLGITKTLFDMSQSMTNAARDNYKMVVDSVGWEGLAQAVGNNPDQLRRVESILGLGAGELKGLAQYKKPLSEMERLELENKRLQNLKIMSELTKTGDKPTGELGIAQNQAKITAISSLLSDAGLSSAVGPNPLARVSLSDFFTGAKSNFIATVEQLREQLTLDKLTQAKQQGATFGALSDGERQTLAAAATKLGTWAIKDGNGNIVGYRASEDDFKAEVDKINNFAKLDFVLNGGDPSSVDVEQMPDGTLWTKNSNGTFTQIR